MRKRKKSKFKPPTPTPDNHPIGWTILRVTLAALLAAHGWARLLDGGVVPFGGWLTGQGVPMGVAVAGSITALEIFGTPVLAWGRFVLPLTLAYAAVLATGLMMVHAEEGWFVVGAGRNGMEYSVLLIVCLLGVGAQHLPRRTPDPA